MLRATILRIDGSTIADDVEIQCQNSKRGTGDGRVWRGSFSLPVLQVRPSLGDTLVISIGEDRAMSAVVTMVEDSRIHFRAPGRMPVGVTHRAAAGVVSSQTAL
jgi:hypothetical protein